MLNQVYEINAIQRVLKSPLDMKHKLLNIKNQTSLVLDLTQELEAHCIC
jgi:hypothetical protein